MMLVLLRCKHTYTHRHAHTLASTPSKKMGETLSELVTKHVASRRLPLEIALAHPFSVNALQLLKGERPYLHFIA